MPASLSAMVIAGLAFASSAAWAGPKVVSGPGANPACFKPWNDKTKYLQWDKKAGPYRVAIVNGFVGNTWRILSGKATDADLIQVVESDDADRREGHADAGKQAHAEKDETRTARTAVLVGGGGRHMRG